MEATVVKTPLNEAQLFLLQTFAHIKSEESFNELNTENVLKSLDFPPIKVIDIETFKLIIDN